tara:strand:+ start:36882 stop:37448 length:567 start_codon:yes stop_codon:yes gene_type:complete
MFSISLAEYDEEIIYEVSSAVLSKSGHDFEVIWFYRLDEESWEGKGTLKIYGKDYLSLELPFMEVLIKKSIMSIKYPEEDQVLIDYFNRRDSSNIFAVLLSEFDGFIVEEVSMENKEIFLKLIPEALIGFEVLNITVSEKNFIPKKIHAISGEEMEVSVNILSFSPLSDREALISKELDANEIIDLRK